VIIHRNNLLELVVPPNLSEILSGTFFTDGSLEPPKFVGSEYDVASRTVTLTFNFTNPFKFDMTINSMTANVECAADNFLLGNAALKQPVKLPAGETALITIAGTWTEAAIDHFQTAHPGAENIDVNLVRLIVDLDGVTVQMNEPVRVPNVQIP
jgi:hypothetical protein